MNDRSAFVISRRTLLAQAAAMAAASMCSRSFAASANDVVDVHYHVTTEAMRKLAQVSRANQTTIGALPAWRADEAMAAMDKAGVSLSVISTPVVLSTAPKAAKELAAFARANNEETAAIVRANPGRFRFFAYLPLPLIDATLRECAYALDTLEADGVYLCTSYGERWLGDAAFAPVLAELDRRGTVVYTHPMGAACCSNGLVPPQQPLVANVPPTLVEYATDTTRTIASLIFSGATLRYPNVKFIFSHAGGSAPFLFERFEEQARAVPEVAPSGVRQLLQKFFYDTAQAANPYALGTLAKLVPDTQILFGSDAPWRDPAEQLAALDRLGFGPSQVRNIRSGNVQRILPSLGAKLR